MSNSNFIPHPSDPRFKDLTGDVYGRLTVTGYAGRIGHSTGWVCTCSCGETTVVRSSCLKRGKSKSCGCLALEFSRNVNLSHGGSKSPEYKAWQNMWRRCTDRDYPYYAKYLERAPSEELKEFDKFLEAVGPRPSPKHSLDRIKNEIGYVFGNLQWALVEQQQNNKSNTIWFRCIETGEQITRARACRKSGLVYHKVANRVRKLGWTVEQATDGLYTE